MTIAAGFLYREGLLLCADTQYTGSLKAQASKLLRYEYDDGSRSVIATVGDGRYARMGAQQIQESIADLPKSDRTLPKMAMILGACVKQLHQEHLYKHPNYKGGTLSVQFLVGLWSAQDHALGFYATEDTALVRLYGYECLGSGDLLGHYLIRPKYKRVTDIHQVPNHSEAEVRRLATVALDEIKVWDPYCGGDSECVTLTRAGKLSLVQRLDAPPSGRSRKRKIK